MKGKYIDISILVNIPTPILISVPEVLISIISSNTCTSDMAITAFEYSKYCFEFGKKSKQFHFKQV